MEMVWKYASFFLQILAGTNIDDLKNHYLEERRIELSIEFKSGMNIGYDRI